MHSVWGNEFKKEVQLAFLVCLALLPEAVNAQFTFTTSESGVIVTGHTGSSRVVKIPETINNLPVIAVGGNTFYFNTNILSVTIPNRVTSIEVGAFMNCSGLRSVRMGYSVANIGINAFYNTA